MISLSVLGEREVPALEMSGDVFPSVAVEFVKLEEKIFFVVAPSFLVDCRVEVIVPPFSALFSGAFADVVAFLELQSDLGPVVKAVLFN